MIDMYVPIQHSVPKRLRPLFTKLLPPGLTCELCNPFNDCLKSASPTNHPADYIICGKKSKNFGELKIW